MLKIPMVGGSEIKHPAYYNIHSGSLLSDILKDNVVGENVRYISGNVLTGDQKSANGYIGRLNCLVCDHSCQS